MFTSHLCFMLQQLLHGLCLGYVNGQLTVIVDCCHICIVLDQVPVIVVLNNFSAMYVKQILPCNG